VNHDASPAGTVGLATAAAKKPRVTWTHADVAELVAAFHHGGRDSALATLSIKFPAAEIDKKLVELGYLRIDDRAKNEIDKFVELHSKSAVELRHLIAAAKKALAAI
jgi:hypothetical protein